MQSSKEIFLNTLNLKPAERLPCAPHWWGIYKYEVCGLDYKKDAWKEGEVLSKVYMDFYEKFKPDWFHLHIGTPIYFKNSEIVQREGKRFLVIDPRYRVIKKEDRYFSVNSDEDEVIVDFADYLLSSRCNKPKVSLSDRYKTDEFIKRYVHMGADEILEMGYTDHVKSVGEKYGREVFIAVHIPSAICEIFDPKTGYLGFEEGLIALHDYPDGMRYLLERCYEEQLEWPKAYAKTGAHAYIISETYVSPDIAGPDLYKDFLRDLHRDYFKEVENFGLIPICNFWGDVNPILEDFKKINIKALMVEESKKTFELDIGKIRKELGKDICIFGNIDSITLLHDGNPEEIRDEVLRQARGSSNNFIVANGSPITTGTPEENVKTMIEVAKEGLIL